MARFAPGTVGLIVRTAPVVLFFLSGCSSLLSTRPSVEMPPARGPSQVGIASWYGPGFHGRFTASGKVYDQHELTAAHQTLPLGTRLIVTNVENGFSTVVTVNDRGPFVKGRIIDLSYAAAETLGMIGPGTAPVRLEVLQEGARRISEIPAHLVYTLQVGSFSEIGNAEKLKAKLLQAHPRGLPVEIVRLQTKEESFYRVQVGSFSDRRDAEKHARLLARSGLSVIIMEK